MRNRPLPQPLCEFKIAFDCRYESAWIGGSEPTAVRFRFG